MEGSFVYVGKHGLLRSAVTPVLWATLVSVQVAKGQITTAQYDNMRSGATQTETVLTPANVNAEHFGRLGAFKVDGQVYAQPLFVPALAVPGKGRHDVLYVATEHDSVYAFDATQPGSAPLWHVSFVDEAHGVRVVPGSSIQCVDVGPEAGITATPVIDLNSGTLYVLSRTMKDGGFQQHLHALDLVTGAEKLGGPRLIEASVAGTSSDAVNGVVSFNPQRENARTALALVKGQVVLSWASECDREPYHGWVMAYNAKTLRQTGVLNTTPNGKAGGIWTSGAGPGVDTAGNIYVATGNGTFDESGERRNYGDSVLKLGLPPGPDKTIAVQDFFTPHDEATLDRRDGDLGSSGPVLLPDLPGAHPHLLVQPTKGGLLHVLDRDKMGGFNSEQDAVVQTLPMQGGGYGGMAYWNGHLFFACARDSLRDYRVSGAGLERAAASQMRFSHPGASPVVTSNHGSNAIVWAVGLTGQNWDTRTEVLYAFDARDITQPIYTSEQNSARDHAGLAVRFLIPIVAKGRVYFGGVNEVAVYGLLP